MGKIPSFGDKQSQQWSKKTSFGRQKIPAMGQNLIWETESPSYKTKNLLARQTITGKGQKTFLRETNDPSNGTRTILREQNNPRNGTKKTTFGKKKSQKWDI